MQELKLVMRAIEEEIKVVATRKSVLEGTLKGLRSMCKHEWLFQCHAHNSTCYICVICGEEKEE